MANELRLAAFAASPISRDTAERFAEHVLEVMYPENLTTPTRLDVVRMLDDLEEAAGIVLVVKDLGLREEGHLDPDAKELVIDTKVYAAAVRGDGRARFTCAHEVGHLPHMSQVHEVIRDGPAQLARRLNVQVKAYRDPEWQASAIGSALLMPRRTVPEIFAKGGITAMVSQYGVSVRAAEVRVSVLRQIGICLP
jgi:Zn-dependent peptidase ImmA (M78 family)